MAGLADPNAAVELSLARANRLILGGSGNTLSLLQAADRELLDRLQHIARKHGGPAGTYTEAHAQIYRQQIRLVTNYVQQRMLGKTDEQAREAIKLGVKQTVALATRLEEHWTGITRPLALHSQAMQDEIVRGTGASRIRQNDASWQRYGDVMTTDFERQLRLGQIMGLSHSEVISRLVASGAKGGITARRLHDQTPGSFPAPTGYVARRYWAERIVRTESAFAYNSAGLNTMQGFRNTDFPDMQKKILAHFDNRTAPDSVAVHGQIRPLDGYFMDGAGRQYLHPPGRPNDRETVIPWRPHWGELEATEPPTPTEQVEAQQEARGERLPRHAVAQRRAIAIGATQTAAEARKVARPSVLRSADEHITSQLAHQLPDEPIPDTPQARRKLWEANQQAMLARSRARRDRAFARRQEKEAAKQRRTAEILAKKKAKPTKKPKADPYSEQAFAEAKIQVMGGIQGVQQAALHLLGKKITPKDLKALLNVDGMLPGSEAFLRVGSQHWRSGSELNYGAVVVDKDRNHVCNVNREITKDEYGKVSVHHALMKFVEKYQGEGLGPALLKGQLKQYLQRGITRVHTEAAWVGQYYWPSIGFRLQSPSRLLQHQTEFGDWLRNHAGIDSEIAEKIAKGSENMYEMSQTIFGKTAKGEPRKIGKEFLVWRGHAGGYGLIPFELDLAEGTTDRQILRRKLGI